jgi:hypothetical protein
MKSSIRFSFFLCLLLVTLTAACSPIKTLSVWKEETYTQPLQKVLIIAVAEKEYIRKQFENILADQLSKHAVEAIPSNKVMSQIGLKPDREAVLAKVKELGVESIIVARSISKEEIINHHDSKDMNIGGVAVNSEGWYGYGFGYKSQREYDSDLFTISTRLYDVSSEKPVWSYVAQARIEGSGQGAVTQLVPRIVEQLEDSQLVKMKNP